MIIEGELFFQGGLPDVITELIGRLTLQVTGMDINYLVESTGDMQSNSIGMFRGTGGIRLMFKQPAMVRECIFQFVPPSVVNLN